jgi:hypothetical protein
MWWAGESGLRFARDCGAEESSRKGLQGIAGEITQTEQGTKQMNVRRCKRLRMLDHGCKGSYMGVR